MPRWLTIAQFSALYQVPEPAVRRLVREQKIPSVRMKEQTGIRVFDIGARKLEDAMVGIEAGDNPDEVHMLRCSEVAQILGVTPRYVFDLYMTGKINGVRRGHRYYFSLANIRQYLEMHRRARLRPDHVREYILNWARRRLVEVRVELTEEDQRAADEIDAAMENFGRLSLEERDRLYLRMMQIYRPPMRHVGEKGVRRSTPASSGAMSLLQLAPPRGVVPDAEGAPPSDRNEPPAETPDTSSDEESGA